MEISGRRFTPHSLSPSSSEVAEWAAKSGLTPEEVFDLEEELFWSLLDNNDSSFSARYWPFIFSPPASSWESSKLDWPGPSGSVSHSHTIWRNGICQGAQRSLRGNVFGPFISTASKFQILEDHFCSVLEESHIGAKNDFEIWRFKGFFL